MSYNGYRLKINGIILPNSMIEKGSYSCIREKRVASNWTDANGLKHINYYTNNSKATIQFKLRERNSADQESLKLTFMVEDEVTVEFWDDYSGTYMTGRFSINRPKYSHKTVSASQGIIYNSTAITMTEY